MKLKKNQPLYRQLKESLEEYIAREAPTLLPTEKELMQDYGVSRKTVRNALAELARDGQVTAIPGKGTVVRHARTSRDLLILLDEPETLPPYEYDIYTNVRASLRREGIRPSIQLISPCDPHLVELLLPQKNAAAKILIFSACVNREDIFELFRDRRDHVLSVGFRPSQDFNAIYPDVYTGFKLAVNHLLAHGHRRIACAGLKRDRERSQAFFDALDQAGISHEEAIWLDSKGTRSAGYETAVHSTVDRLDGITAIAAHNDLCALGIMEYALQHRLPIPEQLSLTGFDNLPDSGSYPIPLTTVGNRLDEFTARSLEFVRTASRLSIREQIPMHLIVRDSVTTR